MKTKTLVIIGGGAAGYFCAINAKTQNKSLNVLLLEKSNKVLSKVKVSGGGRCNVTHACFDIDELSKKYPRGERFLKKAFHWFNTNDTINWYKQKGIELKTEPDGRMFPLSNSSQTIVDCLTSTAKELGIDVVLNNEVIDINKKENYFQLTTKSNEKLNADFLCITSGGFSKESQFNWLKNLGHSIENPVPSLFTFNIPKNNITELMGISVENATIKINGSKLYSKGAVLITHWGLSGPAVLKLSAFAARELADANYNFSISVNWLNNYTENNLFTDFPSIKQSFKSQKMSLKNPFGLPSRLWMYLLILSEIDPNMNWADLPLKKQNALIKNLTAQELKISGKTTFKEEFVTCGGIKLSEVDVNTMQSKIHENLFFAGEILDIDGITGGFNFQAAWTTSWIAAQAISKKLLQ